MIENNFLSESERVVCAFASGVGVILPTQYLWASACAYLSILKLFCRGVYSVSFTAAGIIPVSWKRYTVPAELTVIQWITDFTERVKQFQNLSKASQTGGPLALKVGSKAEDGTDLFLYCLVKERFQKFVSFRSYIL